MLHERIYLDPKDDRVYLDTYVANDRTVLRDAMLVIPGGGYSNVCTEREGEPIALAFFAKGMNCFVLHYRVGEDRYPSQLIDASRAILHIRENADKYMIDPKRVFAVGFSAGGHLTGSLALLSDDTAVLSELGISAGENTPNAVVLAYPVVTALHATHVGSFQRLTGQPFDAISKEDRERLSLERHVKSSSPPAFIWHTAEDAVVPVVGSLKLASAYADAGAPVMLHVYPYGPHGLALSSFITSRGNHATEQPLAAGWIDSAVEFLKSI